LQLIAIGAGVWFVLSTVFPRNERSSKAGINDASRKDPLLRSDSYFPSGNLILSDDRLRISGAGTLTVSNGTRSNAIVKLINTTSDTKLVSFVVRANSSAKIDRIHDGPYRLIFALGDAIVKNTDRFAEPEAFSEFDGGVTYTTTPTDQGLYTQSFEVTLHAVRNGKARTSEISASAFDRY
jgi:hypothetical protein